MTLPIYALSVRQPWAWAIIHAGKRLENRTPTAIRTGHMRPMRIAIHASKGMTRDEYESAVEYTFRHANVPAAIIPKPSDLIRGAIIGTVTVTGIISDSTDPWWCGPRALTLVDPLPCDPIPSRGELGYFQWTPSGGAAAEALPWMLAWPGEIKRGGRVKAAPAEPTLL